MNRSEQFHLLSFEGPDAYARAGGIASRVTGLANALASTDHDTHLWFVGDPELPGRERDGQLTLHRWCQWISHHQFVSLFERVRQRPERERELRRSGTLTARRYAWPRVVERALLPRI